VPTYDYECERCERTYEVRQSISAPALTTCQFCGGPIRRLLAAAPFILKGSGWYVTDYPSESRKKAMEAEKKPAAAATESAASTPAPAPASSSSGGSSSPGGGGSSSPSSAPPAS
jgi:putative FmdB family regulatory protein